MKTASLYELKKSDSTFEKIRITHPDDAYKFIKNFYSDDIEIYESFFILMLNRANETTGYAKISQGGIVGTVVDIRLIAKYCIESLCTGIAMAHNHPSGKLEPSFADDNMTRKVKEALKMFEIDVIDHLIVTKEGYYSYQIKNKL